MEKMWNVYLIHHSHTDIGYTERQEKIMRYHYDFIRQAIEILDDIHSGKTTGCDGFVWQCENHWQIENFYQMADEELKKKFEAYVRSGEIGLSGNYLNMTELVSAPVLNDSLDKMQAYGKKTGHPIVAGMSADINGLAWGYADALYNHGVRYFYTALHPHHGMFPNYHKTLPYYWEGPSGNRVLMWNGDHYHLGNEMFFSPHSGSAYTIRDELYDHINSKLFYDVEDEEAADSRLLDLSENYVKVDEIPFDFTRRRLTTVVQDKTGKTQMVTKGAVEEMLSICTYAECDGAVQPLTDAVRSRILETVDALNDKGFRVLAIAQKSNPSPVGAFGVKDECDMVLLGYLAFLDPPKESTADAIKALKAHGVTTKILTGDNDKVTRTICKQVGLKVRNMLLGADLENMTDAELAKAAESTDVFAKLTPNQKARVVSVLRENGHTVGFMGDGINDAAAMKAADIGISVDTAVDVAKESADIILLEKDLMVLEQGIIEGRKTYANMIKYIKMTASSNFGNMFSVLAASALLPFLPMMSVHLIFLNLIYDLSCTAIPWDNVDEEFIAKPRKWDASSVGNFMLWIGPTSSIFDFTTYIFMYFVFCPLFVSGGVLFNDLSAHYSGAELAAVQAQYIGMFQAGWFVESMWSQTLVIHMIRTPKIPFIQSHASAPVTLLTMTGIAVLTVIPFTPFGTALGFVALPAAYFAYLLPCILLYMVLATSLKKAYVRHYGELL